jgi:glycosyltransferase involved in cell wall biosynthesis
MINPVVHIIIVSYNGKENLKFSLPTLLNQDYNNFKIFIADNNSTDGTKEWLNDNYPEVFYLNQQNNIGMAAMNEVLTWPKQNGIDEEADYIFVAGWDLKFEPRTISHSVNVMKSNPEIGVLGYEVIGLFDWVDPSELEEKAKEWKESTYYDTNWVPGACSFYSKRLLDHIGFLDPVYFAYAEEDDLQYRVKQSGFRTVIINTYCWQDAKVGVIPKERACYLNFRNTMRFCIKKNGVLFGIRVAISILNTACNPFVNLDLSNRVNQRKRPFGFFKNLKIWLRAFWWNIINISPTLNARKECIQQINFGKHYFNQISK